MSKKGDIIIYDILKKPPIYPTINIKAILFQEKLTNTGIKKQRAKTNSFSPSVKYNNNNNNTNKSNNNQSKKSLSKSQISNNKKDIKFQIETMSDKLSDYVSQNSNTIKVVNELNEENEFLIKELNKSIVKSKVLNNSVKESFSPLVIEYKQRGYKIPDLTLKHNLFKKNPLIIESRKDIYTYYDNCDIVKGDFITDIDSVPEKNFQYLNKLKKICDNEKQNVNMKKSKRYKQRLLQEKYESNNEVLRKNKRDMERMKTIRENKENNIDKLIEDISKTKKTLDDYINEEKIEKENKNKKLSRNKGLMFNNSFKKVFQKKILNLKQMNVGKKKCPITARTNYTVNSLNSNNNYNSYNSYNNNSNITGLTNNNTTNIDNNNINNNFNENNNNNNGKTLNNNKDTHFSHRFFKNFVSDTIQFIHSTDKNFMKEDSKKLFNLEQLYNKTRTGDLKQLERNRSNIEMYITVNSNKKLRNMNNNNFPIIMKDSLEQMKRLVSDGDLKDKLSTIYNRNAQLGKVSKSLDKLKVVDNGIEKMEYFYVRQNILNH